MNQIELTHFPGFQEKYEDRYPGCELQKFAQEHKCINFDMPDLPGAPNTQKLYSMSAVQESIREYIGNQIGNILSNETKVVHSIYSQTSWSYLEAISNLDDEALRKIRTYIMNPAEDPLGSTVIQKALKEAIRMGKGIIPLRKDYLDGQNAFEKFTPIIQGWPGESDWDGHGIEFQSDLQYYEGQRQLGNTFDYQVKKLQDRGLNIKIFKNKKDQIVNPIPEFIPGYMIGNGSSMEIIKAIASHRPSKKTLKIIKEDIIKTA